MSYSNVQLNTLESLRGDWDEAIEACDVIASFAVIDKLRSLGYEEESNNWFSEFSKDTREKHVNYLVNDLHRNQMERIQELIRQ